MEANRPGRPEAAAVIWNWQEGDRPDAEGPPHGSRLRGVLQASIGASVGAGVFWFVSQTFGTVIFVIAATIAFAALVSPSGLYALIERAFAALGRGIARLLTWVLLPGIFYLFFVPFGLLFRRGQRDSMKRFFDPSADSYWSDRSAGVVASASRARQF